MVMKALAYVDESYRDTSDLTLPRIREHYANQGIEFKVYTEPVDRTLDIFWNRLPIIQRELSGSQFLIWTDVDMVYQRDFDWLRYVAQFPDVNIWVSGETKPQRPDVCCGFMIFRACGWTFDFLQTWRFLGPMREAKVGVYSDWNRREQETFNILWDWFDGVHNRVVRIAENIVSNPISKPEDKDASVIFHFWGKNYREEGLRRLGRLAER